MTSFPSLALDKTCLKQKFHPSFEEWNFVFFVVFLVSFAVNQSQQNIYKTTVSSVFH